jgi:hypothetical protein
MIGFKPMELVIVLLGAVLLIGLTLSILLGNKRKDRD